MFGNYECVKEKIEKAQNNDELKKILIDDREGKRYLGADCINYNYKKEVNLLDAVKKLMEDVERRLRVLEIKAADNLNDSSLHTDDIELVSEKRTNINRGIRMLVLEKWPIDEIKRLLKNRDEMDTRFDELNNKTVEYRRAMED